MKKVLIIGEIYSENLGDGIICETVLNSFSKNYETDFLDLSGRIKYTSSENYFSLKKEVKNYIKKIIKKFLYTFGYKKIGRNLNAIYTAFISQFNKKIKSFHPDAIIFAGGQMFIDSFINQINYVCNYSRNNNIKVIFNCCGGGKLLYKDKIKEILNNASVKYISLRDSLNYISNFTDNKIVDCYDTAIICNKYYNFQTEKKNKIGIGIMFSPHQSPFLQIKFWKKIIRYLKHNNIDFKLFTNGSTCDQSFAEYILKKVNLDSSYLLEKPNLPYELIDCILNFEGIISMRLHSLIVAYSFNIPSISISWDKKVDTFLSKISCSDRCFGFNIKVSDISNFISNLNNLKYDEKQRAQIENSINDNLNDIKKIINN